MNPLEQGWHRLNHTRHARGINGLLIGGFFVLGCAAIANEGPAGWDFIGLVSAAAIPALMANAARLSERIDLTKHNRRESNGSKRLAQRWARATLPVKKALRNDSTPRVVDGGIGLGSAGHGRRHPSKTR